MKRFLKSILYGLLGTIIMALISGIAYFFVLLLIMLNELTNPLFMAFLVIISLFTFLSYNLLKDGVLK